MSLLQWLTTIGDRGELRRGETGAAKAEAGIAMGDEWVGAGGGRAEVVDMFGSVRFRWWGVLKRSGLAERKFGVEKERGERAERGGVNQRRAWKKRT